MFKVVALLASIMSDSKDLFVKAKVVLCLRRKGEAVYQLLEEKGMFDSTWKPQTVGEMLALPIRVDVQEKEIREILLSTLKLEIQFDEISLTRAALSKNPHDRLCRLVKSWLSQHIAEPYDAYLPFIPQKWQLLGDLVVVPETAFISEQWLNLLNQISLNERETFWHHVAQALGGDRLARQHPIAKDQHRTSQTEMLFGTDGWVEFLDHGVQFGFDATKVMFSSGNVTERRRIGVMDMQGEVVVDAYAGVGYYTLHMASRSRAKHVHACEINPDSIAGLKWACEANGFNKKVTIHQGDNQETLPKLYGQADRCHLGLLPSSEAVWEHALLCLKPGGGWLHIHMNVHKKELEQWKQSTLETLNHLAQRNGRQWSITANHLEQVKWFSPHVWHVVLDVECQNL